MEAAVRGGFRLIEFTLSIPGAFELIEDFATRDGLTVGAGTVLEPADAERAAVAGASFVVSPVTDEAVIRRCVELGVAAIPGTYSATEMLRAHRAGAAAQKLFPAPADGPRYVRLMRGPLPFLRIVPTSGVTVDNARDWFAAGVFAVGFVVSLFEPEWVRNGATDEIERRARDCLAEAHGAPRPPDLAASTRRETLAV